MKIFTYKVVAVAKGGQKINEVALVESFYSVNYVNVNYSLKYSTVHCKYLLFLHNLFFSIKNANIADCLKKHLETHKTKQINC